MKTSLRKLRYDKGLQRKFVAEKIGICGKHLNDIEVGKVNLTDNIASKLSNLYNVKLEEIRSMYEEGKNE
ncbi:helix-turn-helix transcriptional regulator [Clostridium sp. UBA2485]|uniref:helix-turn-helix transcriptional regulator n=1 Tax=Clostridium sp. UBA2485 TaxID=1946352 RepID=UPI0025BD558E|nr:helix-turn-helix transcriptional regulator [Clostridium sp. UBA2485]